MEESSPRSSRQAYRNQTGRPGGNPEFGKTIGFKVPEGQEPNSAQLFLRVKPSLLAKVKSLDNWQDVVREKLEELVTDE